MSALLWLLLALALIDLTMLCILWVRRRQRQAWNLWVRACDLGRRARRRKPGVRLQVDKMHHYLQTPGGRRRTVGRG